MVFTQGDPAGIGPELLLKLLATSPAHRWRSIVVAERSALLAVAPAVPGPVLERLTFVDAVPDDLDLAGVDGVLVVDPVAGGRQVTPGTSRPADAAGALICIDAGLDLVRRGLGDALVTLPVSKASIATHVDPTFRGHTDYLAAACGLECYGRDYLMAFLATDLRVALLSVHRPLRQALEEISPSAILAACRCLARYGEGRIAVPGFNPHAGEGGLLGDEDSEIVAPAVARARAEGLDVVGPESADSVFARARAGAFEWVLALYHDQGLIAVKTAAWGRATNWTIGLPILRTSVDHGTAYDIAGQGVADVEPLLAVVDTTLELVAAQLN